VVAIGQIVRRHKAVQQHVIGGKSAGPTRQQHRERLVVISANDDLDGGFCLSEIARTAASLVVPAVMIILISRRNTSVNSET